MHLQWTGRYKSLAEHFTAYKVVASRYTQCMLLLGACLLPTLSVCQSCCRMSMNAELKRPACCACTDAEARKPLSPPAEANSVPLACGAVAQDRSKDP